MAGLVPAIYVFGRRHAKKTLIATSARYRAKLARDRQASASVLPLPRAGEGWGGGSLPKDSAVIEVTKIKCFGGHRLHATFSDGMSAEHDFSALIAKAGPMGEPLRDPTYFARVFLEDGAPRWPNGFDMCPDWLRGEIEASGAPRPDIAPD